MALCRLVCLELKCGYVLFPTSLVHTSRLTAGASSASRSRMEAWRSSHPDAAEATRDLKALLEVLEPGNGDGTLEALSLSPALPSPRLGEVDGSTNPPTNTTDAGDKSGASSHPDSDAAVSVRARNLAPDCMSDITLGALIVSLKIGGAHLGMPVPNVPGDNVRLGSVRRAEAALPPQLFELGR